MCAPESAPTTRGESPLRIRHWGSVAEGNCVVERRGGEQPEANNQTINKTKLNSRWPDALASMLMNGEAEDRKLPCQREKRLRRSLLQRNRVSSTREVHVVIRDGMAGRAGDVNQGSRTGEASAFMTYGSEEPSPGGDRASVVAKKRGNARRAKGGREVDAN